MNSIRALPSILSLLLLSQTAFSWPPPEPVAGGKVLPEIWADFRDFPGPEGQSLGFLHDGRDVSIYCQSPGIEANGGTQWFWVWDYPCYYWSGGTVCSTELIKGYIPAGAVGIAVPIETIPDCGQDA